MMRRIFLFTMILGMTFPVFSEITIDITSPLPFQRVDKCTNVLFSANLTLNDSQLKDLKLYANGFQLRRLTKEPYEYEWETVPGYYRCYFIATDKDNNVFSSDTLTLIVEPWQTGNLLLNSNFDCDKTWPWTLLGYEGGAGAISLDTEGGLSEGAAAFIEITSPSSADWHLQFSQKFPIQSGHTYQISFVAETYASKAISMSFQQSVDPYTAYFSENITVDGPDQFGPYEFACNTDDETVVFKFNVAGNDEPIFFDDIYIVDESVTSVEREGNITSIPVSYLMTSNYPNPFNSQTKIVYQLPGQTHVKVRIVNMAGETIKTLADAIERAGTHEITWNGKSDQKMEVPSGLYVYQVETDRQIASGKMLFVK